MPSDTRVDASFEPWPLAAGFAIGCAFIGIAGHVVSVMGGDFVADDEGGLVAHVGYAILGFGALALSGATGMAITGCALRRWLHRWPTAAAWTVGIGSGAIVAAVAALGLLRGWLAFVPGRATILVQGLTLGVTATLVVVLVGASLQRARS